MTTKTNPQKPRLDVGDVWTLLEDLPGTFLAEDVDPRGVTGITGDGSAPDGDDAIGGQR